MKIVNITPDLRATLYSTGEMSLRGIGKGGQIELLAWSFSLLRIRDYARLFLNEKDLPEIEFDLNEKTA